MTDLLIWPPLLGVLGMVVAVIIYMIVRSYDPGSEALQKIADAIHEGAMVFMKREYTQLAIFASVLVVAIYFSLGSSTAIAFIAGALSSACAGWFGMYTATQANVRTTNAAHTVGQASALSVAFFGGSIMGLAVASLGLIGLGSVYYFFGGDPETAHHIHGFGMGGSVVALFSRVGGGIYTKSADVGADLVGKIEQGIPEDDPRNPAVIADNVGDNVGDCAGMAADLFETYVVTVVATMVLSSIFFADMSSMMMYPLAIAGVCTLASIVGTYFVRLGKSQNIMAALYKGFAVSAILSAILLYFITDHVIGLSSVFSVDE